MKKRRRMKEKRRKYTEAGPGVLLLGDTACFGDFYQRRSCGGFRMAWKDTPRKKKSNPEGGPE